jgi:hypothetical protein
VSILLPVVIFGVAAALFGTVLSRWNSRCYSEWLYILNVALGVLLLTMLVLRYGYELCLLLGIPHQALLWIEFLIAPVYGAALVIHLIANRHFYLTHPTWRKIAMKVKSRTNVILRRVKLITR